MKMYVKIVKVHIIVDAWYQMILFKKKYDQIFAIVNILILPKIKIIFYVIVLVIIYKSTFHMLHIYKTYELSQEKRIKARTEICTKVQNTKYICENVIYKIIVRRILYK